MSKGIRREKEGEVKQEYKNKILNLIESRGRATFKELLDALGISKPALSKYLKELEQEGLIAWQRNLEDRRSGFYITTEKFRKSDYYAQKLLALVHFYHTVSYVLSDSKDTSQLYMYMSQGLVDLLLLDIAYGGYREAINTYITLMRYALEKLLAENRITLTNPRVPGDDTTVRDIEELLKEMFPKVPEFREELKRVLFA